VLKTVTLRNDGPTPVTYAVSTTPSAQSQKATVTLSSKTVTVRPGATAKLVLAITAAAKDVPDAWSSRAIRSRSTRSPATWC
ncbi:hypothetical protein, partial [Microbacterium aurum]